MNPREVHPHTRNGPTWESNSAAVVNSLVNSELNYFFGLPSLWLRLEVLSSFYPGGFAVGSQSENKAFDTRLNFGYPLLSLQSTDENDGE